MNASAASKTRVSEFRVALPAPTIATVAARAPLHALGAAAGLGGAVDAPRRPCVPAVRRSGLAT